MISLKIKTILIALFLTFGVVSSPSVVENTFEGKLENSISTSETEETAPQGNNDSMTIDELLLEEFHDKPIMVDVARCESNLRQIDENGNVLRGLENPQDVGLFQVNESYWLEEAEKQGINIYTTKGNIKMARVILEQQGISAWNWSKSCWRNYE